MSATVDFSKILFRASSTGEIMSAGRNEITPTQLEEIAELIAKAKVKTLTDKQRETLTRLSIKRDNPELGDTCKKRLIKMYAKERWGREDQVTSKYMEKGTAVEPDSLDALSLTKEKYFVKNTLRLTNRYLTGCPDTFEGPDDDIQNAEEIIDIKSPWSLETFLATKYEKEMDPVYEWQGDSYMALIPSAKRFRLVYTLVNSTAKIINDEKRKMSWNMGVASEDSTDPDFIAACQQIERNHIFDMPLFLYKNPHFTSHFEEWNMEWNIPLKDRIYEIVKNRDQSRINALYKKIDRCRKWMEENCK